MRNTSTCWSRRSYNSLLCGVSLARGRVLLHEPPRIRRKVPLQSRQRGAAGMVRRLRAARRTCAASFPSLPGYVHATADTTLYVNLFIAGRAEVQVGGVRFNVAQETDYPWAGAVRLQINPEQRARMELRVRIPGWARERIMGGSLYRFERPHPETPSLRLNGKTVNVEMDKGYAVIDREWDAGDIVELALPMPVRKVLCDPRVIDNRGKAALQRGPLVYCVEERDADRSLDSHFPWRGIRLHSRAASRRSLAALSRCGGRRDRDSLLSHGPIGGRARCASGCGTTAELAAGTLGLVFHKCNNWGHVHINLAPSLICEGWTCARCVRQTNFSRAPGPRAATAAAPRTRRQRHRSAVCIGGRCRPHLRCDARIPVRPCS